MRVPKNWGIAQKLLGFRRKLLDKLPAHNSREGCPERN
jgi:hypothetical protein